MKHARQALLLSAFVAAAGCNFRLVGGVCADGFVEREGACYAEDEIGGGSADAGGSETGGNGGQGAHNEGGFGAHASGGGNPTGGAPTVGGGEGTGGGLDCGPLAACSGSCVDLDSDPLNCGFCGHASRPRSAVVANAKGPPPDTSRPSASTMAP